MVVSLPARRRQPGLASRWVAVSPLRAHCRSLNWFAGRSTGSLLRGFICGTTHPGSCWCKSPEGSSPTEQVPSPAIVAVGSTRTVFCTATWSSHSVIRSHQRRNRILRQTDVMSSSKYAGRARTSLSPSRLAGSRAVCETVNHGPLHRRHERRTLELLLRAPGAQLGMSGPSCEDGYCYVVPTTSDEIGRVALALSEVERADLAADLLASLESEPDEDPSVVPSLWGAEIERRARLVLTRQSPNLTMQCCGMRTGVRASGSHSLLRLIAPLSRSGVGHEQRPWSRVCRWS